MKNLSKTYNPKEVEDKIYKLWEKSGFFNPDKLPKSYNLKAKSYCIVIPPPNITGELHMGHALNAACQDVLVRKKRMEGFKTLWLPGLDHAGIATQNAVEKELKKEGKTRFDLGRKKFIKRVWQWKKKYRNTILGQFKKLGCSLDWSRTRFTMDKDYSIAVNQVFSHYYKKGWIYQGERTINWCTRCSTSLSDLEVIYKEEPAELYYIKYGPITIATVRPETKLGDTAVAVNPKDIRYKKYISKTIKIQTVLGKAEMKVIGDKSVDMSFGTGAMKVTPAHDMHDFELSEKHGLEKKQVIGDDGKMTSISGKYAGMTVMDARKEIVKDMRKIGILEKTEPYTHSIACCYRCDTILEPILSKQWFLKMKELAKLAKKPVKTGEMKFYPKSFEKGYFAWLDNVRDWCISRQLWWGHRIPLKGETDVLDTWFSAALWPFATLGWPKKTKDLKEFYPTDVLSTARDIMNLWVARMIFSGMEFMKKIPFRKVYIHPIVLTKEGKRMSKSLGTGMDPIQLIEKYGADATRFGILYQVMRGQDIRFMEDNMVMGKKFCNKIWNASRFVLLQAENTKHKTQSAKLKLNAQNLTPADKKILKSLGKIIKSIDQDIESFRFGQAAHKIYDFFWHDFCDIYLEKSKKQLSDNVHYSVKIQTQQILLYVLLNSLKILHPFVPFITEEIYQRIPVKKKKKSLMIETWPQPAKAG
ncbi:valine--tRNA ligase [Patescibacteria group bacterium]|nr:valine--tRNA ligase [Patescibacteria group bacterium]